MKDSILILTEQQQGIPATPIKSLIQQTITVWHTKEFTK